MTNLFRNFSIFIAILFSGQAPAFAQMECALNFENFKSPSIAGCVFNVDAKGKLKLGSNCKNNSAIPVQQIEQFKEQLLPEIIAIGEGTLLLEKENDTFSGKLNEQIIPKMKKGFNNKYTASLDSGVNIKLIIKEELLDVRLTGDFGLVDFAGICKAQKTSSSTTSSSKLDKAKTTCTELGFTLGTEKHGECVLKVMDN